MALTEKESKFLTIMKETRLEDNKLFKNYSEEVRKIFQFTDKELQNAVKKLLRDGMLSEMDLGAKETIYFHTDKVTEDMLDKKLGEIRR